MPKKSSKEQAEQGIPCQKMVEQACNVSPCPHKKPHSWLQRKRFRTMTLRGGVSVSMLGMAAPEKCQMPSREEQSRARRRTEAGVEAETTPDKDQGLEDQSRTRRRTEAGVETESGGAEEVDRVVPSEGAGTGPGAGMKHGAPKRPGGRKQAVRPGHMGDLGRSGDETGRVRAEAKATKTQSTAHGVGMEQLRVRTISVEIEADGGTVLEAGAPVVSRWSPRGQRPNECHKSRRRQGQLVVSHLESKHLVVT